MANSIFPPDYTSDVGSVRVLINDTVQLVDPGTPAAPAAYMFDDDQITAFIRLSRGRLKAAAADMIDALATNEAMVSKKIRTEDLQTDGPAVANSMRLHATALRAAQKRDDEEDDAIDSFEVVNFNPQPCNWPLR